MTLGPCEHGEPHGPPTARTGAAATDRQAHPRLLPVAAASVRSATSIVNGGAPGDRQDRAVGAYDNVIMTAVRG
jgi:hypothetical protein